MRQPWAAAAMLAVCAAALAHVSAAADEFGGRPGLAGPEQVPAATTSCDAIARTLAGFQAPSTRVDLWITGPLTLVQTDGALWYLAICSSPGIRVMCVTYQDNGMKLGDRVTLRGAYSRQDEHHVVLDPCLASRQ